eukprot:3894895-Rhodomonas_salina.1
MSNGARGLSIAGGGARDNTCVDPQADDLHARETRFNVSCGGSAEQSKTACATVSMPTSRRMHSLPVRFHRGPKRFELRARAGVCSRTVTVIQVMPFAVLDFSG